ncbi:hypothetical protein P22_0446 [Propionispora sp. 2/2-37]|uniref:acyl-CoA thioesterase n=1 Tax=Propionispora sp. 2/2-37 TaxID=1677858 RepID=UPI0006BB9983|nr:hotdog domain-containing protein [Propionispora sp. 2/2-37]CUH94380.1 hypothetical protein P22_0446 [Propionispora sp. 2/2-37]
MKMKPVIIHHLVKGADLNHHETLFAGRGAEWLVEAGFIAAASLTHPENIVCLNIHGMIFTRPVKKGSLLKFESKIVYAGKSSLVAYVRVVFSQTEEFVVEGYLTFIHVVSGKPVPHGIVIEPETPEETALYEKGKHLKETGHKNSKAS